MTPTRSLLAVSAVLIMAPPPGAWAAGPAAVPRIQTPLLVTEASGPDYATPLALEGATYARISREGRVVITGFHLDRATRVDLDLERFEIFTPDARIVRASGLGETPMPHPDVVLLRGTIAGQPDSSVFLGLSPHGTNGVIRTAGGRHIISSRLLETGVSTVIYDLDALPAGALEFKGFECGLDQLAGLVAADPAPGGAAAGGGGPDCSDAVKLAVETDWEFTGDLFEGDPDASAAYAAELIAAVSEIYLRDVDVTLLISYLRVWADANDLWTHSSIFDQLDQFQDYYEANMQDVERHTAHFLSGRALSGAGGVAYLPGLCNGEWAYGLSAHLNGSFPYPLEDNNPQNWDVVVVAHELGHNFGAPHTHSMDPPIDECAYGDCTGADEGTIMSYCHTCDGGIANIVLIFHQRIIDEEIIPYLESGLDCTLAPAAANILLHPQGATVCVGDPVTFSVAAEGEPPLSYQWRKNDVDLIGANSTTYQIAAATFAHAGSYDVVVTNVCGDTFSDPAVLVVNDCSADCPWDCQATPDGSVNVADFLAILAQWGQYGTSCDFDGYGVGVADFLAVLAHWGYCPAR
ncbi:MAG: M12 family metallo-peptidase [Planctomycetota bacterium]|jgi:hypothetical protein